MIKTQQLKQSVAKLKAQFIEGKFETHFAKEAVVHSGIEVLASWGSAMKR